MLDSESSALPTWRYPYAVFTTIISISERKGIVKNNLLIFYEELGKPLDLFRRSLAKGNMSLSAY